MRKKTLSGIVALLALIVPTISHAGLEQTYYLVRG